jgi:hypothetical protein
MKKTIIVILFFLTMQALPQSITLVSPNGGEIFTPGQIAKVEWTASSSTGFVKLEYSSDNGRSWQMAEQWSSDTISGAYWIVPYLKHGADSALFKVAAYNVANMTDVSNAPFVIRAPVPDAYEPNDDFVSAYQLTALGELAVKNAMALGSEDSANFDTSKVDVDFYKMTLVGGKVVTISILPWPDTSQNGVYFHYTNAFINLYDQNKKMIASANSGSALSYAVSQSGVYYCKVAINSNPDMWSKYHLSIKQNDNNAVVTLLSPNGGESYSAGQVVSIRWTKDTVIPAVALYYSRNNATTWNFIGYSDTGSYSWIVPPFKQRTDKASVKVVAANITNGPSDVSDGNFTIQASAPDAYEPNNNFPSAYSIGIGDSVVKNATVIEESDSMGTDTAKMDEDFFKITLLTGTLATVSAITRTYGGVTPSFYAPFSEISLYDPSGNFIGKGKGSLSHVISQSGVYFIKIAAFPCTWLTYFLSVKVTTILSSQQSSIDTLAFQKTDSVYTMKLITDTTKLNIDLTMNKKIQGSVTTMVLAPEDLALPSTGTVKVKAISICADSAFSSSIKTADIVIPYNVTDLNGNPETSLTALWLNDATNQWTPVSSSIDMVKKTIVVHTTHFSIYGVFVTSQTPVVFAPQSPSAFEIKANFLRQKQSVAVDFSLPQANNAELKIFDIRGKCVRRSECAIGQGRSTVMWNLGALGSGKYFLNMKAGSYQAKDAILIIN